MRDGVLGLCILGSLVMGYFFAENGHDRWMHWPIYISLLALAALIVTPMKWQSSQSEVDAPDQFEFISRWTEKIPVPVRKAFSIFLAILFGGALAALASKLGVPMPHGD